MSRRNKINSRMTKRNTICFALLSASLLTGASVTSLSQEAGVVSADLQHHAIPRVLLEPSVDDTLVQVELSKVGGVMVDRGQLLPKVELLKRLERVSFELPKPATTNREDADLAAHCRAAVGVVGRMVRMGASNDWVALPATGFFISDSGMFVTSSHVIHDQDYEGMIVLVGDGRVLPVRAVLADDEQYDVAILKTEGGRVSALPLEASGETGARVAVMSHPVGRFFTFAQGSITRRSFQHEGGRFQEMLEISAEFGPGSSGAPVVNSRGNVIGWVDALRIWPNPALRSSSSAPTLTFRECGVAADILRLLQQVRDVSARATVNPTSRTDLAESFKTPAP